MSEPILVDILIYDRGRRIRIKGVLDDLKMNTTTFAPWTTGPVGRSYPIPIGSSFTVSARVSDWVEDKDGRPVSLPSEPPARPPARDAGRARRASRRQRERARRRAAAAVHGDSAA